MKNFCIKFVSYLAITLVFASESKCQVSNYIYGINNVSPGVFYFSKVEISTGIETNLQLLPIASLSGTASSCVDVAHQKYYFCTSDSLMTFNAVTGNLISHIALPIAAGSTFAFTQFNPCDSNIYGLIVLSSTFTFARYNPKSGIMTSFASFANSTGYTPSGMSIVDEDAQLFIIHFDGYTLLGLDLLTGQTVFNTPIINLPGEIFGHIAMRCGTHLIYGTSAFPATTKYLSTIDPISGIVSHVSTTGWNVGIWKPQNGGNCINQLTNKYYYSGVPNLIVGVDIASGNMISSQSLSSGLAFLFLEHFSECRCRTTGLEENSISNSGLSIFPNPTTSTIQLIINTKNNAPLYCEIMNVMGERVYTSPAPLTPKGGSTAQLDVSFLAKGIYLVKVIANGNSMVQKVVKM